MIYILRLLQRLSYHGQKNINEECDAPWQIVLESKNPVHCVFITLVILLELYLTTQQQDLSPYVFDFSCDFTIPGGGDKTNDFVANSDQFIADRAGPLGSHSNQKWSATQARACGATQDERDYCGCWKRDHHVSDCYDDDLLYPDAKVASFLCVGGPCKYCIKPKIGYWSMLSLTLPTQHMVWQEPLGSTIQC